MQGNVTVTKLALRHVSWLVLAAGLAGCAAQGSPYGDPGAQSLPPGATCQSIRAELNRLDARGVPARVQAAAEGRRLAPAQQAEADRYNQLLSQYLGGRCHV